MKLFGDYLRHLRIKRHLTLREFCRNAGLDSSNWSKVERNLLPPPKSKQILSSIGNALKLREGSEEWHSIIELAIIGHIPTDLLGSQKIVDKLPVFFRTLRGQKPTREELEKLGGLLKEY